MKSMAFACECLTLLFIGPFPFIEALSGDAEVATGIGYMSGFFRGVEDPKFPADVMQFRWTHGSPPQLTVAFFKPLSIEVVISINKQAGELS